MSGADGVPVRGEDEFDVEAVARWLREKASHEPGLDATPEVRQFPGGASNLTYLLRYPTRDLVLRRPPTGSKAKGAHDVRREFTIQSRLAPVFSYVPAMVALCDDTSVIGSEFYVMERLQGTILRRDLPTGADLDEAAVRKLCTDVLDVLVQLHSIDPEAAGLSDLGRGTGYVARQVAGWSRRFRDARTPNVGSFETVMRWLDTHQPEDVRNCLIHNDFRFDNVVLGNDPLQVVGVLDWEMATLGDPLMDLGGALAYWVEARDDPVFARFRRQPTHVPGMLTRTEVVAYYASRTGLSVTPDQWTFYEVFGLFRLAVIAQQIYYRYFHRQTTNRAYRQFYFVVLYLGWRCRRLVKAAERRERSQSATDTVPREEDS